MCIQKTYVADRYRSDRIGSYYNCGHCAACQQQKAARRTSKIVHHSPEDFIAYFVTLTFDNDHIPYVLRSDVERLHSECSPLVDRFINVYQSVDENGRPCRIGKIEVPASFSRLPDDLGLVTDYNLPTQHVDTSRISICFNPVVRNFFKRFRINCSRTYPEFGKSFPLSYYYAPEYGPTTFRFHAHLILWMPKVLTEEQVRSAVVKAWPFADSDRTEREVSVAISPASYVASYVNCDTTLPDFLRKAAPPRSSHSLHFGFDKTFSDLSEIVKKGESQCFTYHVKYYKGRGDKRKLVERDILYPSYVLYRFFPKVKAFSRCSYSSLLRFYQTALYESIGSARCHFRTQCGVKLFPTSLVDRYGNSVYMSLVEFSSFKRRLADALDRFTRIGFSRVRGIRCILDYLISRSRRLYVDAYEKARSFKESVQNFFNLDHLVRGRVRNFTLYPYVVSLSSADIDPNTMQPEVEMTKSYSDMFNSNMKYRKLNYHYSN